MRLRFHDAQRHGVLRTDVVLPSAADSDDARDGVEHEAADGDHRPRDHERHVIAVRDVVYPTCK